MVSFTKFTGRYLTSRYIKSYHRYNRATNLLIGGSFVSGIIGGMVGSLFITRVIY